MDHLNCEKIVWIQICNKLVWRSASFFVGKDKASSEMGILKELTWRLSLISGIWHCYVCVNHFPALGHKSVANLHPLVGIPYRPLHKTAHVTERAILGVIRRNLFGTTMGMCLFARIVHFIAPMGCLCLTLMMTLICACVFLCQGPILKKGIGSTLLLSL